MPSTVIDVPAALGEYMLKGWILTDKSCPKPGCSVPVMRSPPSIKPPKELCVKCEASTTAQGDHTGGSTSSVSTETGSRVSRSSTPPTEASIPPRSPPFELPPESEFSRLRREQSDRASTEIGKRLLKGWAMLADECPSDGCYGVPLVRPPKTNDDKDTWKECVICNKTYLTEVDPLGRERLVEVVDQRSTPPNAMIPSSLRPQQLHQWSSNPPLLPPEPVRVLGPPNAREKPTRLNDTLEESSRALQQSLGALSTRLTSISSSLYALDPTAIAQTADAIGKVAEALKHVRALHSTGG